jgi:5-formyltetrahydrofolate cyclo-ligase
MANLKSDSDDDSITVLKQKWRSRLKQIRLSIDPNRSEHASKDACSWLIKECKNAPLVLSFASFGSEINLWPFNEELAKEKRLVLPRIVNRQLQLFQVSTISQLERHSLGFLEPDLISCSPIDFSLIEISLIPALGFDLQTKFRLGYGRGYYDRLLSTNISIPTWGIGFVEQAAKNLPHSLQDIPLKQIFLF